MQRGDDLVWCITLKEDDLGQAVGIIHYRLKPKENQENRGFWLAEPYHGKGMMTEAIIATQDFVFFELNLKSFKARNAISNIGSRRVKEKTGAKLIGTEDKPCGHVEGPTQVWEVTRENWAKIRGRVIPSEVE